jgi:hypothetical protein
MRCLPSTANASDRFFVVNLIDMRWVRRGCLALTIIRAIPCGVPFHAQRQNQQVKAGTSALPELRTSHAPRSKDAKVQRSARSVHI